MDTKTWWCRRVGCGVERVTFVNEAGYFNPPPGWLQIYLHGDAGDKRVVANVDSEYCAWQFLLAMPEQVQLTAPERTTGTGKPWWCKQCQLRYNAPWPRAGSISIAQNSPIDGKRAWILVACGVLCAAEYLEASLFSLLEAA